MASTYRMSDSVVYNTLLSVGGRCAGRARDLGWMRTAYVCIQSRYTDSELPEENLSRYTGRPGSLGLTIFNFSQVLSHSSEVNECRVDVCESPEGRCWNRSRRPCGAVSSLASSNHIEHSQWSRDTYITCFRTKISPQQLPPRFITQTSSSWPIIKSLLSLAATAV